MTRRDDFTDVAGRLGGALIESEPLVGGVSARVSAVDVAMPDGDVRRVVVRQPGAAEWKGAGPETARREFELLEELHRAGLPVPRALFLDDERAAPYFVMDFVEGSLNLPADGPEQMAEVLARVHAVSLEDMPPLPDREDPLVELPRYLGPAHAELRARLTEGRLALKLRRTLLHGDFWPGNVLWRGNAIAALLDWEDAAIGDPLSDVACCRLELRYVAGAAGVDAFTRAYAEHGQRGLEELPIWDAYVAAAALASMGQWGLPAEREAHMRREAEAFLAEAARSLR